MIISHSRHDLNIAVDADIKRIGLKISGGADSAIVGYMLSKYVVEEKPDAIIVPITVEQEGKAFQITFAKRIIEYYKTVFGNIYADHEIGFSPIPESENYVLIQEVLTKKLYQSNAIQFHFAGITLNPPVGAIPKHIYEQGWRDPPDRVRTSISKNIYQDSRCLPLINFDKRDVAELYDYFGVRDTLFPLTRSCEMYTDNFSQHCDNCWFCAERKWGFGRL
jgi:7-cyano-7-deazaguanine synthase in queuosine biosynthesis